MQLKSDICLKTLQNLMDCPDTYLSFLTFWNDIVVKLVDKSKDRWEFGINILNKCLLKYSMLFQSEEFSFNESDPSLQTLANYDVNTERMKQVNLVQNEIINYIGGNN